MKLQVNIDNIWHYVFCRNDQKKDPIICKDKAKAIKGTSHALQYFQRHYGNLEFRISKEVI